MRVLLFDVFKHLLLKKTEVINQNMSKTYISRKENLKNYASFEEQKCTGYVREKLHFGIITFSCLSSTKLCLIFLLNCFVRKRLLLEFFRK